MEIFSPRPLNHVTAGRLHISRLEAQSQTDITGICDNLVVKPIKSSRRDLFEVPALRPFDPSASVMAVHYIKMLRQQLRRECMQLYLDNKRNMSKQGYRRAKLRDIFV